MSPTRWVCSLAAVSLGLSSRLVARLGHRPVLVAGLTFVTSGLVLLTRLPTRGSYLPDVLPAGLFIGVGFGLAFPLLAAIAVGSAPPGDAGVASGLFNTTQQVGGALGFVLLTRLATIPAGDPGAINQAVAAIDGYHLAFGTAAGLAAAALLLALPATAITDPHRR